MLKMSEIFFLKSLKMKLISIISNPSISTIGTNIKGAIAIPPPLYPIKRQIKWKKTDRKITLNKVDKNLYFIQGQ